MSKVITGKVRFSYVALLNPRNDLNGNSKYSVTALLPKTDIQTKQAIDTAIAQAIEEGRNGKWNGVVPPLVPNPIHDGDGARADGSPFGEECKGCWVFTASTNADPTRQRPEIVGPDLQPIMSATEIYSGMYGRLSVNFAPYFSAGKKGIGCYLNNVQKLEDELHWQELRHLHQKTLGVVLRSHNIHSKYSHNIHSKYSHNIHSKYSHKLTL